MDEVLEAFLLSRQVAGCTSRTVTLYGEVLKPFLATIGPDLTACSPLALQRYLTALRERVKPVTVHLHFSKLRAFFGWCLEAGLLTSSPLACHIEVSAFPARIGVRADVSKRGKGIRKRSK